MAIDRRHPRPSDMGWYPDYYRINACGEIFNDDGEEIPLEEYGLDGPSWNLPTIQPEEIHRRMRALVITDDGGARDESAYFSKIIFKNDVATGAMHAETKMGRIYLPDFGICEASNGRHRRDVFVIEETLENIRLLRDELMRTGYYFAVLQLEQLYPKWLQ